jgi:hypothetical protein
MKLVAAHDSSMELVEIAASTGDCELPLSRKPSNKTFIIVTIQLTLCTPYIYKMHVLIISFFFNKTNSKIYYFSFKWISHMLST